MPEPQPLRIVDPSTGEIVAEPCPNCAPLMKSLQVEVETLSHQLNELTRKHHGTLAQLGRWRADKAAEAKEHRWWSFAVALFQDWKVASGRVRSQWTSDRFWMVQPHLERSGYAECRYAVWGLCAAPMVKQITPDYQEVYDSWEVAFDRGQDNFERYRARGVAIFGADLPLAEFDALLYVHRERAGVK